MEAVYLRRSLECLLGFGIFSDSVDGTSASQGTMHTERVDTDSKGKRSTCRENAFFLQIVI